MSRSFLNGLLPQTGRFEPAGCDMRDQKIPPRQRKSTVSRVCPARRSNVPAVERDMPHYIYESRLLKAHTGPAPLQICGVDEAGRGPLAGPVVAAAVILQKGRIPKGLNDSKQL